MEKRDYVLDFVKRHSGKKIINYLPNKYNIALVGDDLATKMSDFCEKYDKIEKLKLLKNKEIERKKPVVIDYLMAISDIDIEKNSFYFTLKIRAKDAINKIMSLKNAEYDAFIFDNSIY